MWQLAMIVVTLVAVALRGTRLGPPALLASRIAFGVFVVAGLAYFPYKAGWNLQPIECEWTFDAALAVHSMANVPHIVLFAIFFPLTYAQLPGIRRALAWSFAACLAMGFLVEIAQGLTGVHHCRMRNLIPNTAGALIGAVLVVAGRKAVALARARTLRGTAP